MPHTTDAIPLHHANNLSTLIRAARTGDLALISAQRTTNPSPRCFLCVVSHEESGPTLLPFAEMLEHDTDLTLTTESAPCP